MVSHKNHFCILKQSVAQHQEAIETDQLRMKAMKIGYARTSTLDQTAGYEAQLRDLDSAGAEKIFKEQVSAVAKRDELEAALDYLRDGDALIVTTLSRLGRSKNDCLWSLTLACIAESGSK